MKNSVARLFVFLACAWSVSDTVCLNATEVVQKFQGNGYDPQLFRVTGPGAGDLIRPDRQGLRITLPPEHGMKPAVGIALHSAIKGDFEATVEFEIVQIDTPKGNKGAGVTLYLTMASHTKEAATMGCVKGSDDKLAFFTHRATTPLGEKRKHILGESLPTQSKTGKLRFERIGPVLHYSVAEEDSLTKFEEIFEQELGEDDINMLRFAADNGNSPTLVDVRLKEITIRADEIGSVTAIPPPSRGYGRHIAIGCVCACVLGGGYWYRQRRA